MESKICTVKLNISPPTQRAVSRMVADTAISLMPNDSVCSWICVSAWNRRKLNVPAPVKRYAVTPHS